MQRAHGGDEPHAAGAAQRVAQLGHGAHGDHAGTFASSRVCSTITSKRREKLGRGLLDRGALGRHRLLVAARDRPGQSALGPHRGPVLHRLAHQRRQQLTGLGRREVGPGGDSLGGGLEGDQEVRGHRGGGVVGGPAAVVDLEGVHAQCPRELLRDRQRLGARARDGAAGAGEGLGALVAGERLQRVQPERVHAGGLQGGEPGGSAGVADVGRRGGHDLGGHRDLGVGDAEDDRVAVGTSPRPTGPSTVRPAARSARESDVPRRPAPTTPTEGRLEEPVLRFMVLRSTPAPGRVAAWDR